MDTLHTVQEDVVQDNGAMTGNILLSTHFTLEIEFHQSGGKLFQLLMIVEHTLLLPLSCQAI
jgi:hypothetical protein